MEDLKELVESVKATYDSTDSISVQANKVADKLMRTHSPIAIPDPVVDVRSIKHYSRGYLPVHCPSGSGGSYNSYACVSMKSNSGTTLTHNSAGSYNLKIYGLVYVYNCWDDNFAMVKNYRTADGITGAPILSPHSVFKNVFTVGTAETKKFTLRHHVNSSLAVLVKIYYDGGSSYYFQGFDMVTGTNKGWMWTGYRSHLMAPCGINLGVSVPSPQLNKTMDAVYMLFESSISITDYFTANQAVGSQNMQWRYIQNFNRYLGYQANGSVALFKKMLSDARQSIEDRSRSDWFTNYADNDDYGDEIVEISHQTEASSWYGGSNFLQTKPLYMMIMYSPSQTQNNFAMEALPCWVPAENQYYYGDYYY